jgi:hypothetical protein
MTRFLLIISGINLLAAFSKLLSERNYEFGRTYVITQEYVVWYIFYFVLLISLGVLTLYFVNKQEVRTTVLKNDKLVKSIRILALVVIIMTLVEIINVPIQFGNTMTTNLISLVLNLVFDVAWGTLSLLTLCTTWKFFMLQLK